MYQFFVEEENIVDSRILITDSGDYNHIKNVLRIREGEQLALCCSAKEKEYICRVTGFTEDAVETVIEDINGISRELPVKLTLFQGLPKGDKMELIIQKAVELGAARVVPVAMKRCVVKLDAKKSAKKVARWNEIARGAAKQSKRTVVPEVAPVMTYKEALACAREMDMILLPYEDARGIRAARETLAAVKGQKSVGIFIGPEGGFEEAEVASALEADAKILTLGHRILRTETAGMAILSILMFMLEEDGN